MTEGELKLLLYIISSHPDYLEYSGREKVTLGVSDVEVRLRQLLNLLTVKQGLFTNEVILCIANKLTCADMDVRLIICRLLVYVCFDADSIESCSLNPSIIRILFSDYDIFMPAYKDLIDLKHMYMSDQDDVRIRNEKRIFCAMLNLCYLKIKCDVALAAKTAVHAAQNAICVAESASKSVQYQQQLKFNLLLKNYRLCFCLIPPCPVRNDLPPKPQCSSHNSTLVGTVYLRARVRCALTQSQFALASVIGIVGLSSRGLAQGAQPSRSTAPVVTTGDFANLAFLSVLQGGSVVSRYEPGMSDNITALADRRQRF